MVKSAERVAQALTFLASNPAGALYTDLQRGLDLPKSSLHALLTTLVQTRLATFDENTKRYSLGPLVWELTTAFSNQIQLVPIALPHLEQIGDRFGETVQLATLDVNEVVYMAKVPSRHPIQLVSNVGTRLPAYATGIGKALLACLSEHQVHRLYPSTELARFTPATITSTAALIDELHAIRERGFARDLGEYSPGIFCVAVPILTADNLPRAALSLSIPAERYANYNERELVGGLTAEAYAIARKLGSVNPGGWQHAPVENHFSPR